MTTEDLRSLRERTCVTQAVLVEGMNQVRVYQPGGDPPGAGFRSVAPTLEDAYLAVMRGGASLEPPRPAPQQTPPPPFAGSENSVTTAVPFPPPLPLPVFPEERAAAEREAEPR